MKGNDVLVSLPTGFGESLCFPLLPYVFDYLRGGDRVSHRVPKSADSASMLAADSHQVSMRVKSKE